MCVMPGRLTVTTLWAISRVRSVQEHPDSTASALAAVTSSYDGGGLRARSGSAQVPRHPLPSQLTPLHPYCSLRLGIGRLLHTPTNFAQVFMVTLLVGGEHQRDIHDYTPMKCVLGDAGTAGGSATAAGGAGVPRPGLPPLRRPRRSRRRHPRSNGLRRWGPTPLFPLPHWAHIYSSQAMLPPC